MKIKSLSIWLAISIIGVSISAGSFVNGPKDNRKIYIEGMPTPDMAGRKPDLIPQAIPRRVRYMFAPNEVVNAAAEILGRGLDAGDAKMYADSVMLQPGGCKVLKGRGLKNAKGNMSVIDPSNLKKGNLTGGLEMRFLGENEEIDFAAGEIAKLLKEDDGFTVRALTSDEMKKWWIFIPFDIEEPVLVAASKGGKYKFVFELSDRNKAVIVDELNALPKSN